MNSEIVSTGSYLPERVVRNEELVQFPAAAVGLIAQKTGVSCRRRAAVNQCTSDLAAGAAVRCLEKIGFPPCDVEAIIVSTSSPDRIQPATATRVQERIGSHGAFAFDINSVCSGSVYGICLADSLIRSGQCENVLLVAAELYSRFLNPKDFSTYPYFGDGAGAILFRKGAGTRGVIVSSLSTDGVGCDVIHVPAGGTMMPAAGLADPNAVYFRMNGKAVFAFAVEKGTEIIRKLAELSEIPVSAIDCLVLHQANINIIRSIAKNLELPEDRFPVNLSRYGNTASASVPIALDEALSDRKILSGNLVATVAFGGGLSWGANLIRF